MSFWFDEERVTSIQTLCLVLLREARMERGVVEARVPDVLRLSISKWDDVNRGKAPLNFSDFLMICDVSGVPPWQTLAVAEWYFNELAQHGWNFLRSPVQAPAKDMLTARAREYWASTASRCLIRSAHGPGAVLSVPVVGGLPSMHPVFRYATDHAFRIE